MFARLAQRQAKCLEASVPEADKRENASLMFVALAACGGSSIGICGCMLVLVCMWHFVGWGMLMRQAELVVDMQFEQAIAYGGAMEAAALSKRMLRPQSLQLDLSLDGETGLILDYIAAHPEAKPNTTLVVDIGAYDCITFSNSYNFIKDLGWHGLLVEPFPENQRQCNEVLGRLKVGGGHAVLAPCFVGLNSGVEEIYDCGGTHTKVSGQPCSDQAMQGPPVRVERHEVIGLLQNYSVPMDFGILSVDVEDTVLGTKILLRIITSGYAPMFIIAEGLLKIPGYKLIANLRFNAIFVRGDHYPGQQRRLGLVPRF
mmetsp:Transcript_29294/g.51273  ORF Transcript_29294/g.51273 Transcript_29294/m.51273 type:complete len:315 (+) Transcript_29294:113-1057(+)